MGQWINYHHLYYFKTIAEQGSVSKAAEKLRLGQPTLSTQLKQFEEVLGVALFERQHKKLTLTEHGKVALEYARNIFRLGDEMYEVLHDKLIPMKPELCVGALDSIPKRAVLDLTRAALKIAPCRLTMVEGKSDELLRELAAHRVDLLLTNFVPVAQEVKGLTHRNLARSPVALYGSPKFRSLKKGFPGSARKVQLLLPTYDSKLRYDLDHWCKTHNVQFEILGEGQDLAMKKTLVTSGLGLLPAGAHTVAEELADGSLIEIGKLEGIVEELFLVAAQRKIANPVAQELFKSFRFETLS